MNALIATHIESQEPLMLEGPKPLVRDLPSAMPFPVSALGVLESHLKVPSWLSKIKPKRLWPFVLKRCLLLQP